MPARAVGTMRAQLAEVPSPGMLAHVEGLPVGWCGFGPRPALETQARSAGLPRWLMRLELSGDG